MFVGIDFGVCYSRSARFDEGVNKFACLESWPGQPGGEKKHDVLSALLYRGREPVEWGWVSSQQYFQNLAGSSQPCPIQFLEDMRLKLLDVDQDLPPNGLTPVQLVADYLSAMRK